MKNRIIFFVAGAFVLTGILLSHYTHPNWIWLSVFVGVNMLQSAFTNFCPLEKILTAVGVKE